MIFRNSSYKVGAGNFSNLWLVARRQADAPKK